MASSASIMTKLWVISHRAAGFSSAPGMKLTRRAFHPGISPHSDDRDALGSNIAGLTLCSRLCPQRAPDSIASHLQSRDDGSLSKTGDATTNVLLTGCNYLLFLGVSNAPQQGGTLTNTTSVSQGQRSRQTSASP